MNRRSVRQEDQSSLPGSTTYDSDDYISDIGELDFLSYRFLRGVSMVRYLRATSRHVAGGRQCQKTRSAFIPSLTAFIEHLL